MLYLRAGSSAAERGGKVGSERIASLLISIFLVIFILFVIYLLLLFIHSFVYLFILYYYYFLRAMLWCTLKINYRIKMFCYKSVLL